MKIYTAAKVIVEHPSKAELLLVKRQIADSFGYEAAGGRVEVDFINQMAENLETCAIREAQEELGLDIQIIRYLGSYSFFWTVVEQACTICAVFLAKTSDISTLKDIGDPGLCPVFPEWVPIKDILENKLIIRENHAGLGSIFHQAALCQD